MNGTVQGNLTGDNSVNILLTVTTVSYTVSLLYQETNMHSAQPKSAIEMKRMFLPEVQDNPQASPYFDLIQSARNSGQEYWQIWHLFAFRAEITAHLARFTHGIMHEPSPLSSGLRELIAAYTSYLNECEFCTKSHAAIAAELLGSEDLVWSVLRDLEGASLAEKEKALLRYVGKVTRNLPAVTEDDAQALRNAGWTDADIYYALTVCSLFNFYNRWVTASGVHAVSHEGHRVRAKVMAQNGYIRK
jgi:uncharacterized peroxidase-related enzyme